VKQETSARTAKASRWPWAIVIALTLGVFALYTRTLGQQSLWFDEGLSIIFAARPLPQLLQTLIREDLHPPLYYLLLHFWMTLAGNSEWAVRLPSAMAAVLLVPLAFAVIREVWGVEEDRERGWAWSGTAAATWIAASPFIAFYAQETRMYSLAAMLTLATTWAFLKALRAVTVRWWLMFSCLLAASLYTLYMAAFVLPVFVLYASVFDRKVLPRALSFTALSLILYLPWVVPAYQQLGRLLRTPDYWVTTRMNPVVFLRALWRTLLPRVAARTVLPPVALVLILGALLLAFLLRRGRLRFTRAVQRGALVFLAFFVPIVLTYAAVTVAPKFATRYAIGTAAPLYIGGGLVLYALLIARYREFKVPSEAAPTSAGGQQLQPGARSERTLWTMRVLFVVIVVAVGAMSLRSALAVTEGRHDPRDDARGLAAYLTENAQAGDALLLVEYAPYALQYYYQGAAPWYGLHVGQDFLGAASVLNGILQSRPRRIWLVQWHYEFADPTDMAVTELSRVGREVPVAKSFPGYTLRAFDVLRYDLAIAAFPKPETETLANFGPSLQCLGFDRFQHGDGRLYYVFYWQAQQPLLRNYSLTLSLKDALGNEYLRRDQALSTPYFLPPVWPLQTPIRGLVALALPADLPPLSYHVSLKVFDPEARRNLDLIDGRGIPLGQELLLEELTLAKSDLSATSVEIRNPLQADMSDGLQLLAFSLPNTAYSQGDTFALTLWWQAVDTPDEDHVARFRLLDSRKEAVWEEAQPIVSGHATSSWQPGEINRSIYRLAIPADLAGGQYHLLAGTDERLISLASLDVTPREHRYDLPAMQQSLNIPYDEGITLLGYDLQIPAVQAGRTVTVTLYWQTVQQLDVSYKVSLQLLSPDLSIVAQDDSIPAHWTYPTTAWLPGEIIVDEHMLEIAPEAATGSHSLITVLYDEQSGQRIRAQQGGQSHDYAALAIIQVAPGRP